MGIGREYWHELGSNKRFKPRTSWWHRAERRGYVEGLRDANRIIEAVTWKPDRDPSIRQAMQAIHERAQIFDCE